jgi:hypothetical protein
VFAEPENRFSATREALNKSGRADTDFDFLSASVAGARAFVAAKRVKGRVMN